jgi:hypothetical protein
LKNKFVNSDQSDFGEEDSISSSSSETKSVRSSKKKEVPRTSDVSDPFMLRQSINESVDRKDGDSNQAINEGDINIDI